MWTGTTNFSRLWQIQILLEFVDLALAAYLAVQYMKESKLPAEKHLRIVSWYLVG